MKNVLMMLAVVSFSLLVMDVNAQIQQGQIGVGLDMSAFSGEYSSSDGYSSESRSIGFGPRLGYFVSDKFQVGVVSGFTFGKSVVPSNPSTSKSNSWLAGPFASYYHEVGERLYMTGTFETTFGQRNSNRTEPLTTERSDRKSFMTSLDAGFTYATKGNLSFGLEIGGISYTDSEYRRDIGEPGETTSSDSGFSLDLLKTGDRDYNSTGFINVSLRLK